MKITLEDLPAIEEALKAWFVSQNLTPHDAAFIMADMAARIVGIESHDEKHLQEGLTALFVTMKEVAPKVFKAKHG